MRRYKKIRIYEEKFDEEFSEHDDIYSDGAPDRQLEDDALMPEEVAFINGYQDF